MTTESREKMITDSLSVVEWSIYNNIQVNEQVQGLGYDDLYQVGCLALCEATLSYNGSTKFNTYAKTFVRNRLIDHCRKIKRVQEKTCCLENPITENIIYAGYAERNVFQEDETHAKIYADEIDHLLERMKRKYSGVTLKGIEAIELKIKGYTGVEIAALYKVKPNLLAAWISRAKNKLKEDAEFMSAFPDRC